MIKLKYLNFRNPVFIRTMQKVAACPIKDPKALYNAMRICKKISSAAKEEQKHFMGLIQEFAVVSEDGKIQPVTDENGVEKPGTYKIRKEKEAEWDEKLKEYVETDWEMERYALKLSDLSDAHLTPEELAAIEEIIDQEDLKSL